MAVFLTKSINEISAEEFNLGLKNCKVTDNCRTSYKVLKQLVNGNCNGAQKIAIVKAAEVRGKSVNAILRLISEVPLRYIKLTEDVTIEGAGEITVTYPREIMCLNKRVQVSYEYNSRYRKIYSTVSFAFHKPDALNNVLKQIKSTSAYLTAGLEESISDLLRGYSDSDSEQDKNSRLINVLGLMVSYYESVTSGDKPDLKNDSRIEILFKSFLSDNYDNLYIANDNIRNFFKDIASRYDKASLLTLYKMIVDSTLY